MTNKRHTIALAAGGTGGHLFSAVALAESLLARGHGVLVLTDSRGAQYGEGTAVRTVPTTRLSGGFFSKVLGLVRLAAGVVAAAWHLKRSRARLLIGFGGYPSVPPALAAKFLRIPLVLVEQNAVMGRANHRLARMARVVATAFPEVLHLGQVPHRVTGIPVRPAVVTARNIPYRSPEGEEPLQLLVFGGSQGAHVFAEVLPRALSLLPDSQRARMRVTQQARPEDVDAVRAAYAELAVDAEVSDFFSDLPERMANSHLVIARAGASTIAEVTTIGRPAVLVPFPYAMDDHQTENARAADTAGAAWLMPQIAFTPEALAQRLETLLTLPACAASHAERARSLGRPDAAERLADLAESLLPEARPLAATLRSVAP